MGKKHLCFFQTAETGNWTPNSGVKGSGANHYPRAPAQIDLKSYMWQVTPTLKNSWNLNEHFKSWHIVKFRNNNWTKQNELVIGLYIGAP